MEKFESNMCAALNTTRHTQSTLQCAKHGLLLSGEQQAGSVA